MILGDVGGDDTAADGEHGEDGAKLRQREAARQLAAQRERTVDDEEHEDDRQHRQQRNEHRDAIAVHGAVDGKGRGAVEQRHLRDAPGARRRRELRDRQRAAGTQYVIALGNGFLHHGCVPLRLSQKRSISRAIVSAECNGS